MSDHEAKREIVAHDQRLAWIVGGPDLDQPESETREEGDFVVELPGPGEYLVRNRPGHGAKLVIGS